MSKIKKQLTLEQIEIIRSLENRERLEGFEFEIELGGYGKHLLYAREKLKRNYDLKTGEFHEYTSKYNTIFHQPTQIPSQVLPTSRIQYFGRNNYNQIVRR